MPQYMPCRLVLRVKGTSTLWMTLYDAYLIRLEWLHIRDSDVTDLNPQHEGSTIFEL